MLPRSSPRVAELVKISNQIAREYDQEYVGTEHLLLAIPKEGTGIGAGILEKRGVTYDKLRGEVDRLVKQSLEETWVFGRLPGTPHFKNVMATAIEECQQLEMDTVRTEHILLALLKERGSVACSALANLGVTYDDTRKVLTAIEAKKKA